MTLAFAIIKKMTLVIKECYQITKNYVCIFACTKYVDLRNRELKQMDAFLKSTFVMHFNIIMFNVFYAKNIFYYLLQTYFFNSKDSAAVTVLILG